MLKKNYDSLLMLIAFISGLVLSIIFNPLVGLFVLLLTSCTIALIKRLIKINVQATSHSQSNKI